MALNGYRKSDSDDAKRLDVRRMARENSDEGVSESEKHTGM